LNNLNANNAILVLANPPGSALALSIANGERPRIDYHLIAEALKADFLPPRGELRLPGIPRKVSNKLRSFVYARRAFLLRKQYNRIFCPGQDMGLVLAFLLGTAGWKGALTVMLDVHRRRSRLLAQSLRVKLDLRLVFYSQSLAEDFKRMYPSSCAKIFVTNHSVDTVFFSSRDDQTSRQSTGYVFMCGRENRDFKLLTEVIRSSPHRFVVSASGFMGSATEKEQAPQGFPNLERKGWLSFPDLRRAYDGAACVVVPLNDVEYAAGSTGLLEAMAMGRPVVVTRSRGIAEYLSRVPSLVVAPAHDSRAFTQALSELLAHPENAASLGERNRAAAVNGFSVEKHAQTMAGIVLQ
jgi:glycosyltransferase involved in cell wall biosynthesis